MERSLLFLTFSCFLIQNIQSSKIPFENGSKLLTDNYGMSAEEFASKHLSGTKFCESVLLPTDHSLIRNKTLQATPFNERKNDIDSDDNSRLDSCCRSLHKCDAYKHIELGNGNDSSVSFCDCVDLFRACLKKMNNSVSSDLAYIHSINATKCYAKEHPIIKCIEEEVHPNLTSTSTVFHRCNKYEFDYGQPKKLQLLDLPFIHSGTRTLSVPATVKDKVVEEQDIEAENRTRLHSDLGRSILAVLNRNFILFFNGGVRVTFNNTTFNFN